MVLDDVIAEARVLLQDSTETYRYSDAVLLGFANQALRRIAVLRPDLFAISGNVSCTENAVIQSAPSDSLRLIDVLYISGGNAVIEAEKDVLDRTYPGWVAETAGAAVNWMRYPRDPNKFFIYPKAPAAQTLVVQYSQSPPVYAGANTVALLPDAFYPAVLDATLFLAESLDNEHVNSGRAKLFMDSFVQTLGVNLQVRPLSDVEDQPQPPPGAPAGKARAARIAP